MSSNSSPSPRSPYHLLGLGAPADLLKKAAKRYKLVFADNLDESEWQEEETKPISPTALRKLAAVNI